MPECGDHGMKIAPCAASQLGKGAPVAVGGAKTNSKGLSCRDRSAAVAFDIIENGFLDREPEIGSDTARPAGKHPRHLVRREPALMRSPSRPWMISPLSAESWAMRWPISCKRHNLPVMENRIARLPRRHEESGGQTRRRSRLRDACAGGICRLSPSATVPLQRHSTCLSAPRWRHACTGSFSVDEIGLSKPRREVYTHVAQSLDLPASAICLVAAHPWDVHGARSAGLHGAFVFARPALAGLHAQTDHDRGRTPRHGRGSACAYGLTAGFRSSCRSRYAPSRRPSRRPSHSP